MTVLLGRPAMRHSGSEDGTGREGSFLGISIGDGVSGEPNTDTESSGSSDGYVRDTAGE
jgi:hypothetical protein